MKAEEEELTNIVAYLSPWLASNCNFQAPLKTVEETNCKDDEWQSRRVEQTRIEQSQLRFARVKSDAFNIAATTTNVGQT